MLITLISLLECYTPTRITCPC